MGPWSHRYAAAREMGPRSHPFRPRSNCRVAALSLLCDPVAMVDPENSPRLLVAIVDDEETVRCGLSSFFVAAGLDVETFASGHELIESASSHRPDCAVVDLQLPGLSGLETLARLLELGIDVPTVIVTGHHMSGGAGRALAAGAVAYARKPLDAEALLITVLSAIRERRPAS